jgi:hypothetical protein
MNLDRIEYNQDEENDKLQIFLFNMIEEEIDFIEQARREGYQLNAEHTVSSLSELERYVLDKGINYQDKSDEALHHRSLCWYYLGEVVRENFGGYWQFSMNEDNTMHWGLYVIEGHTPIPGLEFEPLGLLKRFTRRRNLGSLRRAIESQVNPEPVDLSEFPDEDEFVE